MLEPLIRADYVSLEQIAQSFDDEAQRIHRVYEVIEIRLARLKRDGWIADAASEFYRVMDGDVVPAIERLKQALADSSKTTREIIRIFKAAEEEAAACLRGDGDEAHVLKPLPTTKESDHSKEDLRRYQPVPEIPFPNMPYIRDGVYINTPPSLEQILQEQSDDSETTWQDALSIMRGAFINRPPTEEELRELEARFGQNEGQWRQFQQMLQRGVYTAASDVLIPGTPEHKAARWEEYLNNPDSAGWSYERWSLNYDLNMLRARDAQARVEAYAQTLDWGTTQQTNIRVGNMGVRRLDIADYAENRGIEFKSGNYFYRDPDIRMELARDQYLVEIEGWDIDWVFEVTEGVSQPLIDELKAAGMDVIINGVQQ